MPDQQVMPTDTPMAPPTAVDVLEQAPHRVRLAFAVAPDMPCFEGHFPQLPVLAGVVQVHWAILLAERFLKLRRRFQGLQSVKFQHLVRPPAALTLELVYNPERDILKFSYHHPRLGRVTVGAVVMAEST